MTSNKYFDYTLNIWKISMVEDKKLYIVNETK